MAVCAECARGNHRHDRYPDGRGAECPYIVVPGAGTGEDNGCRCPFRASKPQPCPTCDGSGLLA